MFLQGSPEQGQQRRHLERRQFLKGLMSLGLLAMLYSLVPSCFRKDNKPAESVPSPTAALPSTTPAESGQSAGDKKESVDNEKEAPGAISYSPVAILYREELKEYDFGPGALFRGKRYGAFIQYLRERLPAENNYSVLEADFASDEDLLLICNKDYIDFNKQYFNMDNTDWPVTEQFLKYHTLENKPEKGAGKVEQAARLLVGQAKMASDLVQMGEFKKALSVGGGMHHAFRDHGEAFCIYNDVAFCALYLMKQYGLERILILDTDAHAGNGTSSYFYSDPRVLFIDIHQDHTTIYPGPGYADEIGSGAGTGYTINIPLPPGADYDCFREAFEAIVEPVTEEFQPQIIIWEGGADTHLADPITNLGLRTEDFEKLGRKVRALAEVCDGKAIRLIVSGYTPEILPFAWYGAFIGFAGIRHDEAEFQARQKSLREAMLLSKTEETIKKAKRRLRGYWKSLQ